MTRRISMKFDVQQKEKETKRIIKFDAKVLQMRKLNSQWKFKYSIIIFPLAIADYENFMRWDNIYKMRTDINCNYFPIVFIGHVRDWVSDLGWHLLNIIGNCILIKICKKYFYKAIWMRCLNELWVVDTTRGWVVWLPIYMRKCFLFLKHRNCTFETAPLRIFFFL